MLNKKIERDDESKTSQPAVGPRWRDVRDELTARAVPSAVHGRAWTKNRENNPMQSRVNPGSQHSCCAASGREKKNAPSSWPNLIPLYLARRRASRFCPTMTENQSFFPSYFLSRAHAGQEDV